MRPTETPRLQRYSQKLRAHSTDVERKLWRAIRDKQIEQIKFRRQVILKPYIADFLSHEPKLIIELDGGHHQEQEPADKARTDYLNSLGYQVLRFWNSEVVENFDGVLEKIRLEILRLQSSSAAITPRRRTRARSTLL